MHRLIIILGLICLVSCNNNNTKVIGLNNKFETVYRVYWNPGYDDYTVYTDNETFTCSFNGTNYLLEKGGTEELFSSTAPIRIKKQYKYDGNGNRTEYIK